jgi:ABC-type polysaccharide/polyol phosphate transport system ATPase subunit
MGGKIELTDITKSFRLQHQRTIKELFQAWSKQQKTLEQVVALKNLSFTINQGETVGIIGRNGAGKSTLLKLIAGVSSLTSGQISVIGRVAPLIELGAGFHFELSGRENIFLNGVILGLSEKYIREKFSEIVAFSEIPDFIDTPIKYYSSGMHMRLAFAIAVFMQPEILLVDEILAVGDNAFQQKCLGKMAEFKQQGVTIVFVSHDLPTVEKFCQRVIYLKQGQLVYDGETSQGINCYQKDLSI